MNFLARIKNKFFPVKSVLPDTEAQQHLDSIAAEFMTLPQVECPIVNTFTPGLYARQIFMPRGSFVISKIHKTRHQYVITSGDVSVWIEGTGVVRLKAPHYGITDPGTRRILYTHADTIWTTFHPTKETNVDKIEAQIIEPRDITPRIEDLNILASSK